MLYVPLNCTRETISDTGKISEFLSGNFTVFGAEIFNIFE